MKTAIQAVRDGHVSDELLGKVNRKVDEIVRRMKGKKKPLDSKWVLHSFQKIIEGPTWPVWKNVVVGEGKYPTLGLLAGAIEEKGWEVNDEIDNLFRGSVFGERPKKLLARLVAVTAKDLLVGSEGYKNSDMEVYLSAIYERALKLGLQLCPVEAGLLSFLRNRPSSNGDMYVIAMEPIWDKDENEPRIIGQIISKGKLWSISAFPKSSISVETKFIFCKGYEEYPGPLLKEINRILS